MFKGLLYMVTVFFENIRLDWLFTTVSNRSRQFNQNIHNSKERFCLLSSKLILKPRQNKSLILRPMKHVLLAFLSNIVGYKTKGRICFSEVLACFAFLKHSFWDSPFCLITNDIKLEQLQIAVWKQSHGRSKIVKF